MQGSLPWLNCQLLIKVFWDNTQQCFKPVKEILCSQQLLNYSMWWVVDKNVQLFFSKIETLSQLPLSVLLLYLSFQMFLGTINILSLPCTGEIVFFSEHLLYISS